MTTSEAGPDSSAPSLTLPGRWTWSAAATGILSSSEKKWKEYHARRPRVCSLIARSRGYRIRGAGLHMCLAVSLTSLIHFPELTQFWPRRSLSSYRDNQSLGGLVVRFSFRDQGLGCRSSPRRSVRPQYTAQISKWSALSITRMKILQHSAKSPRRWLPQITSEGLVRDQSAPSLLSDHPRTWSVARSIGPQLWSERNQNPELQG